jgi:hypothetical protein
LQIEEMTQGQKREVKHFHAVSPGIPLIEKLFSWTNGQMCTITQWLTIILEGLDAVSDVC